MSNWGQRFDKSDHWSQDVHSKWLKNSNVDYDEPQEDEEESGDWFEMEEKRLADKYGGNFIRVKYTSQDRIGYYCELCLAECNAKVSLDAHCSGMKHLKKKDIWEKEIKNKGDRSVDERDAKRPRYDDNWRSSPDRRYRGRREPSPPAPRSYWDRWGGNSDSPPRSWRPSTSGTHEPPPFGDNAAVTHIPPPSGPRESLSQSPTGTLVQKLAACCVKNAEDEDLALNVISCLLKSVKEYSSKIGQAKSTELLTDAEMKVNTVRAIKLGMQMLNTSALPGR